MTTCAPDGEGKWCGEYTKSLLGKVVRIVVDHDDKGEKHGQIVAKAIGAHVREVKIIHLPGLPPKGDLWDSIEAGGKREQLQTIVEQTAAFQMPAAVSPEPEPGTAKATAPESPNSLLKQLRNDTGNAERLILKFGDRLRYCPAFRKWLVWDDRRWAVDDKGAARRLAKQTMLAYLAEATDADEKDNMSFAYSSLEARRIRQHAHHGGMRIGGDARPTRHAPVPSELSERDARPPHRRTGAA